MSAVVANMSMSLDDFVADRNGSVKDLFGWYTPGIEGTPPELP